MTFPASPLPEYNNPPISEMVLGIQFEPLEKFGVVHFGLAWQEFRGRYPHVEQQAPLSPTSERFGSQLTRPVRIQIETAEQVLPRLWFVAEHGQQLLQLQRDRFLFNWRKMDGRAVYPRYGNLRANFVEELATFSAFLLREDLGVVKPNQCEVTYVNELMVGQGGSDIGELERVLTIMSPHASAEFSAQLEGATEELTYVIPSSEGDPLGRLRVILQPVIHAVTGKRAYLLRLTAQGRPDGSGLDGVLRFLDIGHEWAVRGFTAITTPYMHQFWGRTR